MAGVSLMVVGVACGPAAQQNTGGKAEVGAGKVDTSSQGTPKPGGILRQAMFAVAPSWEIISEGTGGTHMPIAPIYSGLIQYDPLDHSGIPNKIVPDLAEKWDTSQDGTVYTFHLRPGAKWHDGQEFTSADVKFSFDRIMDPPEKTPSLRQGWYKGTVKGVETPDKYTAKITLDKPNAAFLSLVATSYTPMLPKHVLDGKTRLSDKSLLIGTGPFKITEADRNIGYKYVKNQDYWDRPKPYLEGMEYTVVLEETGRVAAFRSGQTDVLINASVSAPQQKVAERELGDKIQITNRPGIGFFSLVFNTTKKPFNDVRVRKAVTLAIDHPAVNKIAFDGTGCAGGPLAPGGSWGFSCEEMAKRPGYRTPTPEDIAEAKKLLSDAGYPNGFSTIIQNGYSASVDNTNQLLIEMLKPIGINASIKSLERTAFYASMDNKEFEMTGMGNVGAIDDPNDYIATWYICGGGRNYQSFCDKEADALYDKQAGELNPAKRKEIVKQLQERIIEQMPIQILNWTASWDAWYKYVKGVNPQVSYMSHLKRDTTWLDK